MPTLSMGGKMWKICSVLKTEILQLWSSDKVLEDCPDPRSASGSSLSSVWTFLPPTSNFLDCATYRAAYFIFGCRSICGTFPFHSVGQSLTDTFRFSTVRATLALCVFRCGSISRALTPTPGSGKTESVFLRPCNMHILCSCMGWLEFRELYEFHQPHWRLVYLRFPAYPCPYLSLLISNMYMTTGGS